MLVGRRAVLVSALFILVTRVALPASGGSAAVVRACARSLKEAANIYPGEIGGDREELREFVDGIRADRDRLVAAQDPKYVDLLDRIDSWLQGFTSYLDSQPDQIPGLQLPGRGATPNPPNDETAFERLARGIRNQPRKLPGENPGDVLRRAEGIRIDRGIVASRGAPEDLILVRRADQWLVAVEDSRVFILDESVLDDEGAVLDGYSGPSVPPPSDLEVFFESTGTGVVDEVYKRAATRPTLARKLKASPAALLDKRSQLIYLGDSEALRRTVFEVADQMVFKRIEQDPDQMSLRVADLQSYGEETALLIQAFRARKPSDPRLRIADAWLKVLRARVAANADDPQRSLSGYRVPGFPMLLGRSKLGPPPRKFVPPPEPLGSLQSVLDQGFDAEVLKMAFDPDLDQLPQEYLNLIAMVRSNAVLSRDYEPLLPPDPTPRDLLVALMKREETRTLAVDVAEAILAEESRRELETPVGRVDLLIIGGGKVSQTVENFLRQKGEHLVTLTTELKPYFANTFRQGMYTFSLNSTSRPEDPTNVRQMLSAGPDSPGGDLNFFPGGAVQINQFDNRQNPVAYSAAAALTVNRSLAKRKRSRIRFNSELVDLEYLSPEDPLSENGRYSWRGRLANGENILARSAIDTGIGKEFIPPIPGLQESYQQAKADARPGSPARILTMEDLYEWINSTSRPYAPFSGKIVDVAGPGDSGKAAERWLNLLADPRSYGLDGRSVPSIKYSNWWGQPYKTCDTFTASNRSFYADLSRAYKNMRIVAQPKLAKVELFRDIGAVFLASEETPEVGLDADYLVLALGFKSFLDKLLLPTLGDLGLTGEQLVQNNRYFQVLYGDEPTLGRVPFARQLLVDGKPVPFFTLGPSSGPGIVTEPELAMVEENFVANVNNAWREWYTIAAITKWLGDSVVRDTEALDAEANKKQKPNFAADARELFSVNIPEDTKAAKNAAYNELLLAAEVLNVFSAELDLSGVERFGVEFERDSNGLYQATFQRNLESEQGRRLAIELAAYPRVAPLLLALIGPSARNTSIEFSFGFNADGTVDPDDTDIVLKRRRN